MTWPPSSPWCLYNFANSDAARLVAVGISQNGGDVQSGRRQLGYEVRLQGVWGCFRERTAYDLLDFSIMEVDARFEPTTP